MAEKNIEIALAVTGGDQAADEIRKPAEAAGVLDENVEKIARAQKAQAVAELAEKVGKIAGRFRDAANEVERFDQKAAEGLRNTADNLESVTSGISAVALGFAAGGPLGAAVASLAVLLSSVADAYQASEIAALKSAATQKQALEEIAAQSREAKTAEEERATILSNGKSLAALEQELQKASSYTAELREQLQLTREKRRLESEVLNANDQADLAEIDFKEAGGKLTPKQATEGRAKIEADARTRQRDERRKQAAEDATLANEDAAAKVTAAVEAQKIAEGLEGKSATANADAAGLANLVENEKKKIVRGKDGGLSESDRAFVADLSADVERAKKLVTDLGSASAQARNDADKAWAAAADATKAAEVKTQSAINTSSALDMVDSADRRTQDFRSGKRGIEESNRDDDEAQRTNAKAKAEQERRDREAERRDREANAIGKRAEKLLPDNVTARFRKSFEDAAAKLQDGAQGNELNELATLVETLGSASNARFGTVDSGFTAIRREIEILRKQMKHQ